ncbi:hypothetical protein C8J57DRAFT_1545664 [Mycena rebaudengoi]|nr:hypothetical protein C8J57DRAFT_1545664 [Mycena rebaudengoi]
MAARFESGDWDTNVTFDLSPTHTPLFLSALHRLRPDANSARALLSTLTPFLTALASITLYPTLDSAITDIHSRLPQNLAIPGLFALLLRDAASLLRPALVISEDDPQTSPYTRPLRMLGDLHGVFRSLLELEREAQSREADLVLAENKAWMGPRLLHIV